MTPKTQDGIRQTAPAFNDPHPVRVMGAAVLLVLALGTAFQGTAIAQDGAAKSEITFQDVLKDPDNPEINFLYAQAQIEKGRLDRAVAALERVLLIQPDLTNVRLLYAIVLYRLDNLEESKVALLSLKSETLPADQSRQVDDFLGAIDKRQKRIHHTVSVSMGMHFDTNRNAAPASGTLSVLDSEVSSSSGKEKDIGKVATLSAETRYDPGTQRGHQVYAQATAYTDQQSTQDSLDAAYGKLALGGVLVTDYGNLDISASHARVSLANTAYSNTENLALSLQRRITNDTALTIEQTFDRQTYINSADATTTSDKSGDVFTTSLSLNHKIDQQNIFSPGFSYEKKNATQSYESYRKFTFDASYTRIFSAGLYVTGQGIYEATHYREADTFISSDRRKDREFTYRLTTGVPIGGLAVLLDGEDGDAWIPEAIRPVVITGMVEKYDSLSNLVNYSNENWRMQISLSRTFQF